ncbi:MAG: hypothetical protein JJE52_05815 [Acidimicrobiia bacterium]|nr:hypothetical protein [Acidimicrobiia bacterium]
MLTTWPGRRRAVDVLLGAALVAKSLSWVDEVPTIGWSLLIVGLVAIAGRTARLAFAVASLLIWTALTTGGYESHHFTLLGLLTAYAAMPGRSDHPGLHVTELLAMVQVSTVYAWAAIWKLNPDFLTGSVVWIEWSTSWLLGPPSVPQWVVIAAAAVTILGELVLAGALWARRLPAMWVLGLAALLHGGMILSIGSDLDTTVELVSFALACGSTFPLFFSLRNGSVVPAGPAVGSRLRQA